MKFVQGDTGPDVIGVIHAEGDASDLEDLTGCTVRFQMRKSDDKRFTVNAPAAITNAAGGEVTYQWAANDLAVPGVYEAQWEITYADGSVITTVEPVEIVVRRQ